MRNTLVITIDGPASSGKGTVAKRLADLLGFNYLESGAIYRALALLVIQNNVDKDDEPAIEKLVDTMKLTFANDHIYLNDTDVSLILREEHIGMLASYIAKFKMVREALLGFQRGFAVSPGLVTDGRDMGSIVFPNAILKIFLTASQKKRAERRFLQLQKNAQSATITSILRDVIARDRQDCERAVAPLGYDDSFRVLDNSDYTVDETVSLILQWFSQKSGIVV